ncbi:hypothetical protein MRX96_048867 [Rhipicephalus microplus]
MKDYSSPSNSEGGIAKAISRCGDPNLRSTPAGDHIYSNLPPKRVDSLLARKVAEEAHVFDHMNMELPWENRA